MRFGHLEDEDLDNGSYASQASEEDLVASFVPGFDWDEFDAAADELKVTTTSADWNSSCSCSSSSSGSCIHRCIHSCSHSSSNSSSCSSSHNNRTPHSSCTAKTSNYKFHQHGDLIIPIIVTH